MFEKILRNQPLQFLALALIFPAALVVLGSDWLYNSPGYLDPYIYIGYGFNYPSHDFYPGYYKISRLPWVLCQSLFHHISHKNAVPMLSASLLLGQGLVAFWLGWRLTRDLAVAALCSLYATLQTCWQGSGCWSYHANPSVILVLAAICSLPFRAAEMDRAWFRYLAAFALLAVALHTNPLVLNVAPSFGLLCLAPMLVGGMGDNGGGRAPVMRSWFSHGLRLCLAGLTAFVFVTAILCVIHKLCYGDWLFFMPGLKALLHLSGEPVHDVWWEPLSWSWLRDPRLYYLVPPAAAVVVSIGLVAIHFRTRSSEASRLPLLVAMAYLLAAAVYVFIHVRGNAVLNYDYHSFALNGLAVAPFALLMRELLPLPDDRSEWRKLALALCGVGLLVIALILPGMNWPLWARITLVLPPFAIALFLSAVGIDHRAIRGRRDGAPGGRALPLILSENSARLDQRLAKENRLRVAGPAAAFAVLAALVANRTAGQTPSIGHEGIRTLAHSHLVQHYERLLKFRDKKKASLGDFQVTGFRGEEFRIGSAACAETDFANSFACLGMSYFCERRELAMDEFRPQQQGKLKQFLVVMGPSENSLARAEKVLKDSGVVYQRALIHISRLGQRSHHMGILEIHRDLWTFSGDELQGRGGKGNGDRVVAETDGAGDFAWGPYVRLPKGSYSVTVSYSSSIATDAICGNLTWGFFREDVTWHGGEFREVGAVLLPGTGSARRQVTAQLRVAANDTRNLFQIVAYFAGRGTLAIHDVRIEILDAPPASIKAGPDGVEER